MVIPTKLPALEDVPLSGLAWPMFNRVYREKLASRRLKVLTEWEVQPHAYGPAHPTFHVTPYSSSV